MIELNLKRRYQPYDLGSLAMCEACTAHFGTGWKLYDRWLDEAVLYHASHRLGIPSGSVTYTVTVAGDSDDDSRDIPLT